MKRYTRKAGLKGDAIALFKYPLGFLLRTVSRCRYGACPTQPRLILLESFAGRRVDCNPRAIYNYMRLTFPGEYAYVWAVEDVDLWKNRFSFPDTDFVEYRSSEHRKAACLASVLVVNNTRAGDIPFGRQQLVIQTWHGEGYKVVGAAVSNIGFFQRWVLKRKALRYDYVISSNSFFTRELIRKQLLFKGDVLETGTPRNDRLVVADEYDRLDQRNKLGIDAETFLVLYIPTWRDFDEEIQTFDIEEVRAAFERRFCSHVIMAQRGHYFSDYSDDSFDLDLGDYDDMQGLLLAADAVISDYSSAIWDYSFTFRPCFLYVPDLGRYEENRGFNEPIEEWGFPVCRSSNDLVNAIYSFNPAAHRKKLEEHHDTRNSFESGEACSRISSVIREHVDRVENKQRR